jgi:hypothetical protein
VPPHQHQTIATTVNHALLLLVNAISALTANQRGEHQPRTERRASLRAFEPLREEKRPSRPSLCQSHEENFERSD